MSIECHHVEPARGRLAKALQIRLGRDNQSCLLTRRDAGRSAAMAGIGALSDFNENQDFALLHDEIDFPTLAAKIALAQHQSLLLQIKQRIVFGSLPAHLSLGAWRLQCGEPFHGMVVFAHLAGHNPMSTAASLHPFAHNMTFSS